MIQCQLLPGNGHEEVTENRDVFNDSVIMRSVDDWPLAKILNKISGGKLRSASVNLPVARGPACSILLLRAVCHSLVVAPPGAERVIAADQPLGNSVGAIG